MFDSVFFNHHYSHIVWLESCGHSFCVHLSEFKGENDEIFSAEEKIKTELARCIDVRILRPFF